MTEFKMPTTKEIHRIEMNARQMRADATRAGFRAMLAWVQTRVQNFSLTGQKHA